MTMLAVELRFLAGRYHATPWGRNVNEGVPEWPPSPFRLARAVADAAWRRHPDWDEGRLAAVLRGLAHPVAFLLPRGTASHVRLFQRQGSKNVSQKQKIFDAFVVLPPGEPVVALFEAQPDEGARRDLDCLLRDLNYLGRSESWVDARLAPEVPADWADSERTCSRITAEAEPGCGDVVRVACLRPAAQYSALPQKPILRKKRRGEKADPTMTWVQALCLSTAQLLKDGWSTPPAMQEVDFQLPGGALDGRAQRPRPSLRQRFHEARFALHCPVLPKIVDAVPMAERVRRKLMGIHRKVMNGDRALVSRTFSGKDSGGHPAQGHRHAYLLSLDEDGDGRIDHLLVRAAEPFTPDELAALDSLRSIWQADGRPEVQLVLEALTRQEGTTKGLRWVSATPFVTRRHHRPGRGTFDDWLDGEIKRACGQHGLPEPISLAPIAHTTQTGHPIRWMEFVRSRVGRRPLQGHGRLLTFAEPVRGPFAIGTLAHFGLGLFVPSD